jgi:hypothetical protein
LLYDCMIVLERPSPDGAGGDRMNGERVRTEKVHRAEKDDLVEVDNLEIAPLSEEDLDTVVGGVGPLDSDCTGHETTDGRSAT